MINDNMFMIITFAIFSMEISFAPFQPRTLTAAYP